MQFKPVPEPPSDLEAVEPILAAVPTKAGVVDDCCRHLVAETRLESRTEAETWLVFLRALELVTADHDGYRRKATEPAFETVLEVDHLQQVFRKRIYGAESILETLERADEPLTVDEVGTAYREQRAGSDRRSSDRRERPEDGVTERVRRLLEWSEPLELTERTDGGRYESTATSNDE